MNKVADYTKRINRFGKSLEKMLQEDFPDDTEMQENIEDLLAAIQFNVLGGFMKKGGKG